MKKISFLFTCFLVIISSSQSQVNVTKQAAGTTPSNCENCNVAAKPFYQFNTLPRSIIDGGLLNIEPQMEMGKPEARFKQFIEFGDGYFSDSINGTAVQRQLARLGTTNSYLPIVTTYGVYTPRPPTILSEFEQNYRSDNDDVPVDQRRIANGKNVMLVPSINSAIPSDLMTFAIPFKRMGRQANGVLILLYNNDALPNLFEVTDGRQQVAWSDGDNGQTNCVPIRGIGVNNAFGATLKGAAISDINASLLKAIGAANIKGYNNALIIDIASMNDALEHNIFITLKTNDAEKIGSVPENAMLSLKAMFVGYSSSDTARTEDNRVYNLLSDANSFQMELPYYPSAHDPNATIVFPQCVKTGTLNQEFTFTMHIANEGYGAAKSVWVRPRFKGANIKLTNIKIKKALIGGIDRISILRESNVKMDSADMAGKLGVFAISFDSLSTQTLSFSYTETALEDSIILRGLPFGQSVETYTGNEISAEIIFTATVTEIPGTPDTDSLIADVCFASNIREGMLPIYSTPRPGGFAIKENCAVPPPICTTFWCRYWWLIILILLGLILLIYFLRRR